MARPKKLTLREVMALGDFSSATKAQQTFVLRYIARGGNDALDATRIAYPNVKPKSIGSVKCQVMRSPKVRRILNLWQGKSEMDVLASKLEPLLDAAIKRDKKRGRISTSTERSISMIATHLKSKTKGYFDDADYPTSEAATEAQMIQEVIGKKFQQGGVWYIVTAVEVSK
jgi:hypothetical protein